MKKTSFLIALLITATLFAQKKHHAKKDSFTVDQKTQLMVKKLNILLDLSSKQVAEITPIVADKVAKMHAKKEEFKAKRENKEEHKKMLSSDEKFEIAMKRLEEQEALQNKMENILNKDQYVIWKKMYHKHLQKRMKSKKHCEKKGDHKGKRKHKHEEVEA